MKLFHILLLTIILAASIPSPLFAAPTEETSFTGGCEDLFWGGATGAASNAVSSVIGSGAGGNKRIRISVYIPGITEVVIRQQSVVGKMVSGALNTAPLFLVLGPASAFVGVSGAALSTGTALKAAGQIGAAVGVGNWAEQTVTKKCYYLKGALPEYINGLYLFGLSIAGLLGMVVIMIGGLRWIASGGSPEKISAAKEQMMNAFWGLIILMFAYTMLYIINPNVLILKPIT